MYEGRLKSQIDIASQGPQQCPHVDPCPCCRPDLHRTKTRPAEWAKLQSRNRYFQALFCYIGPPSHVLWNIKWPFMMIVLVSVIVEFWDTMGERACMTALALGHHR